jgi:hypothetical protein
MKSGNRTGDSCTQEKVGFGVITGAFIRGSRVAFGIQSHAYYCYSSDHGMLCIQTLIVLLLPPNLTSLRLSRSDSSQIVHMTTRETTFMRHRRL